MVHWDQIQITKVRTSSHQLAVHAAACLSLRLWAQVQADINEALCSCVREEVDEEIEEKHRDGVNVCDFALIITMMTDEKGRLYSFTVTCVEFSEGENNRTVLEPS